MTERGRLAKNDQIERNMSAIVEFDKRFRAAKGSRDVCRLLELAAWAKEQGLSLGRKALEAVEELK